jgi:hypothetical protein
MTKALVFKYWEDGIQIFSCKWYLYIDWQRSTIRRGSLPDHQEAPELYDDQRTHWIINRKIINFHKWEGSLKTIDPSHLYWPLQKFPYIWSSLLHSLTQEQVSQLVNKMCSQQACSKLVNKTVILSRCYKVVTHNLLTNCWIAGRWQVFGTTCDKTVELNNIVASCQQAVENLSTSWEQAVRTYPVDKLLEQYCYKSAAGLLQLVRFYVCRDGSFQLFLQMACIKSF